MIGINIGSGQRPFTSTPEIEWINLDKIARPWQTVDILCDAAHLPYDDNSIDYVVLHHVLEHFSCKIAAEVVSDAQRVLKPGSSLLIFVPDMDKLARRWLGGDLTTPLYMANVYGSYMGSDEDRHKFGYDNKSLGEFLTATARWSAVLFRDIPDIPGSSFAHDWWILEAEAVK